MGGGAPLRGAAAVDGGPHELDGRAELGQERLGPVHAAAQVGRQKGPPHRGVGPYKELKLVQRGLPQRVEHPAHGAPVEAGVGVAQVARIGGQRRQGI